MKKLFILSVLAFALLTTVSANNSPLSKNDSRYFTVEKNLLKGLTSDNDGLKFSSAYLLGEIQSENAVDYLISMLRDHDDENFRILAALSLSKIGTERGLFMVKRVGKFTDNSKLAKFCDKFYQARTYKLPADDKAIVESLFE